MPIDDRLMEPHIRVLEGLSECTVEYPVINVDTNHNLVSHLNGRFNFFHQILDKLLPDIGWEIVGMLQRDIQSY